MKAIRRKTTGTGRMRYMRHVPRRFKSGFREGMIFVFVVNLTLPIIHFLYLVSVVDFGFSLGTEAAPRSKGAAASA